MPSTGVVATCTLLSSANMVAVRPCLKSAFRPVSYYINIAVHHESVSGLTACVDTINDSF